MKSLTGASDNSVAANQSPILRGRRRRRARRQWQSSDNTARESGYDELRGRSRRAHKRRARLVYIGYDAQTLLYSSKQRAQVAGDVSDTSEKLTFDESEWGQKRASLPEQRLRESYPTAREKLRYGQLPSKDVMPGWLLDASIKSPIHFRRLSAHLKPTSSQFELCIDKSMAVAIRKVGSKNKNNLLKMVLDYSKIPPLQLLRRWRSYPGSRWRCSKC